MFLNLLILKKNMIIKSTLNIFKSWYFWSRFEILKFFMFLLKNIFGIGSKVKTPIFNLNFFLYFFASSNNFLWPIWTPSKLPIKIIEFLCLCLILKFLYTKFDFTILALIVYNYKLLHNFSKLDPDLLYLFRFYEYRYLLTMNHNLKD